LNQNASQRSSHRPSLMLPSAWGSQPASASYRTIQRKVRSLCTPLLLHQQRRADRRGTIEHRVVKDKKLWLIAWNFQTSSKAPKRAETSAQQESTQPVPRIFILVPRTIYIVSVLCWAERYEADFVPFPEMEY
jgi:hypothetical protein